MTRRFRLRDGHIITLLALLPAIALSPFWLAGRLLGPGDGAALHFPLRAAVWDAYRHFDLPSWNAGIFFGTPLLAAYRPGAFYPLMPLLAPFYPFDAFQALVLLSLGAAAVLTFLYLRRLGAHTVGAYVAALAFALGPYLIGHLSDTATLVAAPTLPLLLLAAESHMNKARPGRAVGLAAALALLLLAGSPEAARAGLALVAGRVLLGHVLRGPRTPPVWMSVVALAGGLCLAAPQLLPALATASQSGLRTTGLANPPGEDLPGLSGLVLRYVSHSPAPALALAAVPLVFTQLPFRALAVALAVCLGLQWGRGPLSAPGALPLVFDLALAVLAGLSMSAAWRSRHLRLGRRLRAHFLVAAMASAAALSFAAMFGGPLPQTLAGAVGVLAVAFILWFLLAENRDPVIAGVFLLPLTVSFLLQPHARQVAGAAPLRTELMNGTTTRAAVDGAMGARVGEPILALAFQWPGDAAIDLGYANFGALTGRRSVNGYDPMVAERIRQAFDGMGAGGGLHPDFLAADPARLGFLGVRWVEVPGALLRPGGPGGEPRGEPQPLDVPLGDAPRDFALPFTAATAVAVEAVLANPAAFRPADVIAHVDARLASGRAFRLNLTAAQPAAQLLLPGRYNVVGVRVARAAPQAQLTIRALGLDDTVTRKRTPVSPASAFTSDTALFRSALQTSAVSLYEVRSCQGPRVVARTRRLESDAAVLAVLRELTAHGIDSDDEALVTAADADGEDPAGGRTSHAAVSRDAGSRIDLFAEGPGTLVLPLAFDAGWHATVDDDFRRLFRVNHFQSALRLGAGTHRIALRYRPRGLGAALPLALLAALGLAAWAGAKSTMNA